MSFLLKETDPETEWLNYDEGNAFGLADYAGSRMATFSVLRRLRCSPNDHLNK